LLTDTLGEFVPELRDVQETQEPFRGATSNAGSVRGGFELGKVERLD
jgi:hypothetical protein